MKKYILFIFITFGFGQMVIGQNYSKTSGYLGKRFELGFGLQLSPSLHPQKVISSTEAPVTALSLNKIWSFHGQYAISQIGAIGVTLGFYRTSALIEEDVAINGIGWGEKLNHNESEHKLINILGSPLITATSYGVYYKRYRAYKGAMSPIGSYFKGLVNIHSIEYDFSNIRYTSSSQLDFGNTAILIHKHTEPIGIGKYLELGVAVGETYVVGERLLLDLSFGGGMLFTGYDTDLNTNNIGPSELALNETKKRLRSMHYFNAKGTISYLLF